MKKMIIAAALSAAFPAVQADELGFNAAVTSDYRYRGISQTRLEPALQGGADYFSEATGLYAGVWASTIKWTRDAGGDGHVELDIYGGRRGQVTADVSYDVGVLTYVYAGNGLKNVPGFANADTTEIYGQLGYGPATLKYSHAVTNLFGFVDSKNSGYLDFSANVDMGEGFTANLHAGHQKIRHNEAADYTDWKVGVTRDFGIASLQLAGVGSNASKTVYASPANGKFLGRSALQITLSKTF
jgi:uncharacterized protein (TIGR02001 family)